MPRIARTIASLEESSGRPETNERSILRTSTGNRWI